MNQCNSIEWSELYTLGDEKVDSEHKKLFELAKSIEENRGSINFKNTIEELVSYTKVHFANEEKYMGTFQYNKLPEHKKIHKAIVANLQNIISTFNSSDDEQTYNKILDFVKNGLVQHIMIEDKKVQHFKRDIKVLRNMFTWKDDYLLENKEIDDDHQKLFMIAFKAFSHEDKEEPKKHIKGVILELNQYMKEHFSREEDFMDSIGYPLLEEHKALHERIIDQINELLHRIPTMSLVEFERELLASIDIWLVNHIIHEDHKIICYLKEQENAIDLDDLDNMDENINSIRDIDAAKRV
ncbi:bacteriohemerythrin [Sulfurimonas sp.]|uniref:bacteriohemerythrin n=1 Tax=Sulfurimonas sp. TaxID=2022749 RepID=UPI003562CD25